MVCTVVLSVMQDRHGYEVWISRCRHVAASCLITIFVIFCHETDFQSPSLSSALDRAGTLPAPSPLPLPPPLPSPPSNCDSRKIFSGPIHRSNSTTIQTTPPPPLLFPSPLPPAPLLHSMIPHSKLDPSIVVVRLRLRLFSNLFELYR